MSSFKTFTAPLALFPSIILGWQNSDLFKLNFAPLLNLASEANAAGQTTLPVLTGLTLNSCLLTSSQLSALPSSPAPLPWSPLSFSRHLGHCFITLSPQISNSSFPILLNSLLLISLRKEKRSEENVHKLPLPNLPAPTCSSFLSESMYLYLCS